jgi:cell division transport system ATP-binding protein
MIELRHVSKVYAPDCRALTDISFEIDKGEVAFITGPSGAGKSTLLKLLFRDEEVSSGEILIDGTDITRLASRGVARLRRSIGLVFQEFRLLPKSTVLENVALAADVIGISRRESRVRAYQLLRELGLKDRGHAVPAALSAGEQQRVIIARALVNDPVLLLADEPTGNLDAEAAAETLRLFLKLRDKGATVVIATHDRRMINRFGTRVISLERGALVEDLCRAKIVGLSP